MAKKRNQDLKTFRRKGEKYYELKLPSWKKVLKIISLIFLVIGLFNVAWFVIITPIMALFSYAWLYYIESGSKTFLNQLSGMTLRWVLSLVFTFVGLIGYLLSKRRKKE